MEWWLSDVGRWVEFGRTIRITRRIVVRSKVIQLYNHGIQYQRCLKDESHVIVQVVLLVTLVRIYQDFNYEDFLKYRGRDISESSSVFPRSKDGEAGWRTATFQIHKPIHLLNVINNNNYKRKSVRQLSVKGDYIVVKSSRPWRVPSPTRFSRKFSIPARKNWLGRVGEW
jgi:hypothetical protein